MRILDAPYLTPPIDRLFHQFDLFQMDAVKKAHVRSLLLAFKVPSQSTLRTQQQAAEQASKSPLPLCPRCAPPKIVP